MEIKIRNSAADMKSATVIIPNWNGMQWLEGCLEAVLGQRGVVFDTIVVDNGSSDGSVAFLRDQFPNVRLVELASNIGFAGAVNAGIAQAHSPYVVLLNSDTRADPNWLRCLVERMDQSPPDVGALASQMLRLADPSLIDDAGDELTWYGAARKRGHGQPATNYNDECEVFSICAGASLYRREFLEQIGGFDDSFFAYLEDVDVGLRGRLLGYRYFYIPTAKVLHEGHGSALATARYVTLMTCNSLVLFTKNMPIRLLLRHAPRLVYGQIWYFVAYGHPLASLKGLLAFITRLPATLRARRGIRSETVLGTSELEQWLLKIPPGQPLHKMLVQPLQRWGCKVAGIAHGDRSV